MVVFFSSFFLGGKVVVRDFLVGRFGKSGWVSSLLLGVEDSPPVSVTTGSLFFSVLGIPNNRHSPIRYTLETNQASRHRRKNSELLFCDEILQFPEDPCMVYIPTFTIKINKM